MRLILVVACTVGTADAQAQLRVDKLASKPADRISIFTVRGEGVTIPLVAFQEWSRQAIEAHMHAEIVPMDEMLARGGPAMTRRMVECRGAPRCFQEVIGRTVETRYLLVISASLLGETRLLGARLLDLSRLEIVGEAIREVPSERTFLDELKPRIQESVPAADWDPFGGLAIDVAEPGAQIFVNGRVVGLSPIATLPYLLPGAYEIVAEKDGFGPRSTTAVVVRGETASASLPMVATVSESGGSGWYWWAGVGAAVVGAALVGAVLVGSSGSEPTFCSASSSAGCRL